MIVRVNEFRPCGQTTYAEVYSLVMRENANIVRQYGVVPETLVRKLVNNSISDIVFKLSLFDTTLYEITLHAILHKSRNGYSLFQNALPFADPNPSVPAQEFEQPAVIDLRESCYFDIDTSANGFAPLSFLNTPTLNYGTSRYSFDYAVQWNGTSLEIAGASGEYPKWGSFLKIHSVSTLFHASSGPCIKRSTNEVNSLSYGANMLYDREVVWDYTDGKITTYVGPEMFEKVNIRQVFPDPIPTDFYPFNLNMFAISAKRKPLLDDLKPSINADLGTLENPHLYSQTYRGAIDLPDEYLNILLLDVKKKLFEYYGQPFPQDMEQKLQLAIKNILEGNETELKEEVEEKAIRNA